MNEAMKKLKARAEKEMRGEKSFSTKDKALAAAIEQSKNLDSLISVWKPPDSEAYTLVSFENRENAFIRGFKEIYTTEDIYDKVKERYDRIEEV